MKLKNPFDVAVKASAVGADSEKITIKVPKYVGGAPKPPDAYVKKPSRDALGRILPGNTGNPLGPGRAMNLALYAGELTGGGREMIDFLLAVMRGEVKSAVVTAKGDVVEVPPSNKERMDAADRLLDRSVGKAPATLTVETSGAGEGQGTGWLDRAPIDLKAGLVDLFRKAQAIPEEKQPDIVDGEIVPASKAEGSTEGK